MKVIISLSSLLLLATLAWGELYYSNNVTRAEAIRAASRLRAGMTEQDVEKQLATNGLSGGFGVGSQGGYNWSYGLSDESSLVLDYGSGSACSNAPWGINGILQRAWIKSNTVVITSIALTNAPSTKGSSR